MHFQLFSDHCIINRNENKEHPTLHGAKRTPIVSNYGTNMTSNIICHNTTNLNITFTEHQAENIDNEMIGSNQVVLFNWGLQISSKNQRGATITMIKISNSIIRHITIIINIATIIFIECTFDSTLIRDIIPTAYRHAGYMNIALNDCNFDCKWFEFDIKCGLELSHFGFIHLSLINTSMTFCTLKLVGNSVSLSIEGSSLFNTLIKISVRSFLRVPSVINIQNTSFINNRSAKYDEPFSMKLLNPYVIINWSIFHGFPVEIISSSHYKKQELYFVQITDSRFVNAHKDGNGGALLIQSGLEKAVCKLLNVTFLDNRAYFGKGGAIYARGNSLLFTVHDSKFSRNFADDIGTSLYATQGVVLDIRHTSFHMEIATKIPLPILSVFGRVKTITANFEIDNLSPVLYNSAFNVLTIYLVSDYFAIQIDCPLWYNHNFEFRTEIASNFKQRNYSSTQAITNLRYECGVCSESYYTTLPRKNKISFFPNISTFNETSKSLCKSCPYGAHCSGNSVVARPNFWGYYHEGELLFQQCPKQHCCSGNDESLCSAYNSCTGNRTGALCGACKEGLSVSILSGECIPNSKCGDDHWFWLLAFLMMLAYTIWYTFKDDVMTIALLGIDMTNNALTSKYQMWRQKS